ARSLACEPAFLPAFSAVRELVPQGGRKAARKPLVRTPRLMLISTTANVLSVSNGVRRNERAGTAAARLLDRAKATTKQIHETASVMKKNLSEDPTTPFL